MFDKIVDEINCQDFLNLITQFYCSLSVRKHMQNISCEIREFILMRKDMINKEIAAKKILDFFLRIQSKLRDKTDKDWDQAFQIQIARAHGLIKICDFPVLNSFRHVFKKLEIQKKKPQTLQITFLSNTEQLISNCKMQIGKDIKTKTFYFFKWCQYIQQIKGIRQMKNRQVQNQKISSSFNKYGLKSNTFNAWKIYYKKIKNQKQKAKIISSKCSLNLLRSCLIVIQQASEIISVESELSRKVKQKIVMCKKKQLFKKLRINEEFIKSQIKYKIVSNYFVHQFLNHLSNGQKPFMNKSFQTARNKFQNEKMRFLLNKYFKQIKKLCKDTLEKIHSINQRRKSTLITNWKLQYNQNINFNDKRQKFQDCLCFRRRRVAITLLSFNRLLRKQEFKKIQAIMQKNQNALTHRSFIEVNAKKCFEDRKIKVLENKLNKQNLLFFKKLKENHSCLNKRQIDKVLIKKAILIRLFSRFNILKHKLEQKQQIYQELRLNNQKTKQQQAFRKWRRFKLYHKYQESSLSSIMKYNKKVIMISFWNKFLNRAHEKYHIQTLLSASRLALIKLAYVKIFKKTFYINQKVKNMRQTANRKLKYNLFNLLILNQKYNTERSKLIQRNYAKQCERGLIKKLKHLIKQKNKIQQFRSSLQKNKMRQLYFKLKEHKKQEDIMFQKNSKVSKKLFIGYLRRSIQINLTINERNQYNSKLIENRLKYLMITSFTDQLKRLKNNRQSCKQKKDKINYKLARKNVLKIKQFIIDMKLQKKIKHNQNMLIKSRLQSSIQIFTQKYKAQAVTNYLNYSRKKSVFKDFIKITQKNIKISQNCQKFIQNSYLKNVNQFINFLRQEKKEMDVKIYKLSLIRQQSQNKKLNQFFNLLRQNKQNIQNQQKLTNSRKQYLFSSFLATNLRNKFNRIKFHCSLKMYAKNLMKKTLEGLKNSHSKLKHKQNLMRLDKTSSIMMEKSIQRSFKSHTLSQQIEKFNLRKSRQMR